MRMQILDAMNQDSGIPLTQLQVDGGMTSNRLLMQLQADILCIPVGESRSVHTFVSLEVRGDVTRQGPNWFLTTSSPGSLGEEKRRPQPVNSL